MYLWAGLLFNVFALVITIAVAAKSGGPHERGAAYAVMLASIASQAASLSGQLWRYGPEFGVMAVDVALVVALLVVMHRSRSFWPIWAAAAQMVGTITHLVRWLEPSLARELYATIQPFWVFPVLASILVGCTSRRRQST